MSSGTRIVLGFVLFAALVFAALEIYGGRSLARRGPDSPVVAAREAVQADNTVIGLIGGLEAFEPVDVDPRNAPGRAGAHLEARVLGARDSGRLLADVEIVDGRWTVARATFVLPGGESIPVAGSAGR